ncbi:MAG: tetratricopeptide repeat protein [Deltaproteobacteria bacterium]|nr:tetratricopeptide repeat protein [Deltaproteobacteria bacterium]
MPVPGIPQRPQADQILAELHWSDLLSALDESVRYRAEDRIARALIQAEAFNEADAGAASLTDDDLRGPVARWLLHYLAVLNPSRAAFDRWLAAEDAVSSRKDPAREFEADALQMWRHGRDVAELPTDFVPALLRGVFLFGCGEYEKAAEQAELLAGVDNVLAALIRGALLGQKERAHQLLKDAPGAELLAVEVLLDDAFADRTDLEQSLAERRQVLDKAGLEAHAVATEAFSAIVARRALAGRSKPIDGAVSWRALCGLLARQAVAADRAALVDCYRKQAQESDGEYFAGVMLTRAAMLLVARKDWEQALAVLPTGLLDATAHGVKMIAQRLRLFCLVSLERWSEAALALCETECVARWRPLLLHGALLISAKDPASSRPVLERIEQEVAGLSGTAADRLRSTMLALAGRTGDAAFVARLWSAVAAQVTNARMRGLCALGAGISAFASADYEAARTSFAVAEQHGVNSPVALSGHAIATAHAQQWKLAVDLLTKVAQTPTGSARMRLLTLAARMSWAGGLMDQARSLAATVAANAPDDGDGLKNLAAIQLHSGESDAAAHTLFRVAELSSDAAEAEALFCAAGDLLADEVGDDKGAERAFRKILDSNPRHNGALLRLRTLLGRAERHEELVEVCERLIDNAEAAQAQLELHVEAAGAALAAANSAEDAITKRALNHIDRAVALAPKDDRPVALLAELAVRLRHWDALLERSDVARRSLRGLRALQSAHRERNAWAELADVCFTVAQRSDDDGERSAGAMEAGDIYVKLLNDAKRAESCYRLAAEAAPADPQVWERLTELLRTSDRSQELVEVIEAHLAVAAKEGKAALHLLAGQTYADPLCLVEQAERHFDAALELDPDNRAALSGLARLLDGGDRPIDQARVLERLLRVVEGEGDAVPILLRLAALYGQLGDQRLGNLAARAEKLADHDAVFAFIEGFYRDERPADLAKFYERRIAKIKSRGDVEAAAELLRRKGEVELSQMMGPAAVETFSELLSLQPGDEASLAKLERLLSESGDWQRLLRLFERHADSLDDDGERVRALHRAADVAQQRLGDEAETVRLYERIYKLNPTDNKAFSVLEKKLHREKDHQRLIELLFRQAQMVADAEEKADYLIRGAAICEKAGKVELAIKTYQQCLSLVPNHAEALDSLARIFESLERWKELLIVTQRQIQLGGKRSTIAMLHFKCGSVMETQYGDDNAAFRHYTAALKVSRTCLPALHGLRDLHTRRQDWRKVAQTLEAEAAVWSEPSGKADVLAQAAEVYATKLGDRERALKLYERAIEVNPKCMPAALALFDHCASQSRYKEAVAWGRIYAKNKRGPARLRARFLVRWAELLSRVGEPTDAAEALVKSLQLRPGYPEALYGLLELCRTAADSYDFARAFRELIEDTQNRNDTLATAILSSAAGVLAEQRGQVDEALTLYAHAIERAGPRLRIVLPRADLLVVVGRGDEGAELVESCRKDDTDFSDWLEATNWLARYYAFERNNYQRAAELYGEALEKQPNLDEVRLDLARIFALDGRYEDAYRELESSCRQLAARGGDVERLARRYHGLGLAALRVDNLQGAKSNWRRACDLAPEWPYPYFALARQAAEEGNFSAAERELKLARQGVTPRYPDVLRAEASFMEKRGFFDRGASLHQRAVKQADTSIDDRVSVARCMLKNNQGPEALAMLAEVLAEDPTYLPAYYQIALGCMALGDYDLSRRAAQVVDLAGVTPPSNADAPAPLPRLAPGFFAAINRPQPAIDDIWTIVATELKDQLTQPALLADGVGDPMISTIISEFSALVGRPIKLAYGEQPLPVVMCHGDSLIIAKSVSELSERDVRGLVALAAGAVVLGYGPLLGLAGKARLALSARMAELAVGEAKSGVTSGIAAQLSGRARRQLSRHVDKLQFDVAAALSAAQTWHEGIESLWWKVALALTDDLPGVARALAVMHGIAPDLAQQTGILSAIDEVGPMARYFVSKEFADLRRAAVSK